MDQPGKVANPARGQLNREHNIPLSPCVPENLVSRDGFSRPVPRQPAHLHTQAESGAYLRDSSRVPQRRPFIMKPPYAIGSVPSLSGHAIAYRWRSLPRVRRHRASKSQGSEGFNYWRGRGYDDSSPERSPKQPLPGMRLHDLLHDRQACPRFIAFDQGVGQICPW